MSQKERISAVLVTLAVFLLCATGLAGSGPDEMECLPEGPSQVYLEEDEPSSKGSKGVPRNQVLLEIFTKPAG